MATAYAAHTKSCTFLLDAEGFCLDVIPAAGNHAVSPTIERCIGAQYVASLDANSRGILVDMPRIGLPIVFARVDERGRVSLVRTGELLKLEARPGEGREPHERREIRARAPRTYVPGQPQRRPEPVQVVTPVPAHLAMSGPSRTVEPKTASVETYQADDRTQLMRRDASPDTAANPDFAASLGLGYDKTDEAPTSSTPQPTARFTMPPTQPGERVPLRSDVAPRQDSIVEYGESFSPGHPPAPSPDRPMTEPPMSPYAIPLRRVK